MKKQIFYALAIASTLVLMTSCANKATTSTQEPTTNVVTKPQPTIPVIKATPTPAPTQPYYSLYWEKTTEAHPERAPWTELLSGLIFDKLGEYNLAADIEALCPKYFSLNNVEKVKAIGEFWVGLAYYESGFKPTSSAVDVGQASNRNTYSDGLYQMSGTDDSAKEFGCDYKCLQDPLMNIKVAHHQMMKQLSREGKIMLANSSKNRYWATILVGNKYSVIPQIKARILKYASFCQ